MISTKNSRLPKAKRQAHKIVLAYRQIKSLDQFSENWVMVNLVLNLDYRILSNNSDFSKMWLKLSTLFSFKTIPTWEHQDSSTVGHQHLISKSNCVALGASIMFVRLIGRWATAHFLSIHHQCYLLYYMNHKATSLLRNLESYGNILSVANYISQNLPSLLPKPGKTNRICFLPIDQLHL